MMLRVDGLVAASGHPRVSFEARDGLCVGLWCREREHLASITDALSGLRAPAEGRVMIDDFDTVRDSDQVRPKIASALPYAVAHQLTLLEYARTVAAVRPVRASGLTASSLIERLQLDPHRRLSTPSARSEAALVGALLPDARLIVLADPFTNLTTSTRQSAIDFLRVLASTATTIVVAASAERDVRAVSHTVIAVGAAR